MYVSLLIVNECHFREHAAALTADLDKINLSKFVEEMAVVSDCVV